MASNDNNTVHEFAAAIAQTNANIPSLQNLTVETIKNFVNPGIKELEKVLLEDSERIFTQNNALRCVFENNQNEWLQEIEEEVGTIEERTSRLVQNDSNIFERVIDIEETVNTIEKRTSKLCDPEGLDCDAGLYYRVIGIEETVDDIRSELQRMNDNIDNLRVWLEAKTDGILHDVSLTKESIESKFIEKREKRKRKREEEI